VNPRRPRTVIAAVVLAALAVAATGCENYDGNEWQRLVCEISHINEGTPLVSAYLNVGNDGVQGTDDDFLPIDFVPITFHARPYNDLVYLPEDTPYSWFHVTNYDLIWHPGPGAPSELTDYNVVDGRVDLIVPVHEDATVSVLIADRGMKVQPWYRDVLFLGGGSYTATCELRFRGHETGNDEIIEVTGGFTVTFFGIVTNQS
jgi:hypothetical protein